MITRSAFKTRVASLKSSDLDARKPVCLWERFWEQKHYPTALNVLFRSLNAS